MNVVFRVDASVIIGIGHVMRCLTLADQLKTIGAVCSFICREHPGNLIDQILRRGHKVFPLSAPNPRKSSANTDQYKEGSDYEIWLGLDQSIDAIQTKELIGERHIDLLIVDHYAIDASWEKELRPSCSKLMVIDDLANRIHDCDILLDQNFYKAQELRYIDLVPLDCLCLLGPKYVLLRPEFYAAKKRAKEINGTIHRVLVFFGGSDPANQTIKFLNDFQRLNTQTENICLDIVVGGTNTHKEQIKVICNSMVNAQFHCDVQNMANLMTNATLGVGSGGTAMWERCYIGLPTITVVFAKNQLQTTLDLAEIGAIEYAGNIDSGQNINCAEFVFQLVKNPGRVKRITEASIELMRNADCEAVLSEVTKLIVH
jgi:UDP-2,4-diacetamido-2,4,6-trideoxy-beta-L-altropyranose hydrolase